MKYVLKIIIGYILQFLDFIENRNLTCIDGKMIDDKDININVKSDTGYVTATKIWKTKPFQVYRVEFTDGTSIEGADIHILFDKNLNEIYIKDLQIGTQLCGDGSIKEVKKLIKYPFKLSMYDLTVEHPNHRYYTNDVLSHNSVTAGIFITWYLCFHYDKNILVLANKMDTTKEIIDKIMTVYKNLPFFMKPGAINAAKTSLTFDNGVRLFSQATTKTAAIGFTIHLLFADEFAHIPNNFVTSFYRSVYPTLSSSKISRIIITSTPNGMNLFYQLYTDALEGKNEYNPMRVDWWQVPDRDEKWKQMEIANLGSEELFNQEYGLQFLASSRMLLSSRILQYLKRIKKHYVWKEVDDFDDFEGAYDELRWHPDFDPNTIDKEKDKFVFAVDVGDGVGADYTVCNIFKIEIQSVAMIRKTQNIEDESSFFRLRQVGIWRSNTHSVDDFSYILEKLVFNVFNPDIVRIVLEINFKGNVIIEKLSRNRDYYPEIFMHTQHAASNNYLKPGVKIKSDNKEMYSRELKNLIKQKRLIVNEHKTFEELGAFGLDKNGKFCAQSGHDDIAMSLVNTVPWFTNESFFEYVESMYDKQPELVRMIIDKKVNDLPDENELQANMKWLKEFM